MASPLTNLLSDDSRYEKCHKLLMERTSESQYMQDFINNQLPEVMASTLNGKSRINVIGVGNGNGEFDLQILSALHLHYPEMAVDNEVVEPNPHQQCQYKDLVSKTPGLDYIKYNWNDMTAEEFEEQWIKKKMTKKADLIHMFHMLYYVKDIGATISFFQSLLNKNGKLLISQVSGRSAWGKLSKRYINQLGYTGNLSMTTADVKKLLDSKGLSYQTYELPAKTDITECFTEGDENGEMLLDFFTHVLHFSKSVSPELKAEVMEFLRRDCSVESNVGVMIDANMEVLVIDQLT